MTPIRLLYVTGTRADFGLMLPVLRALDRSEAYDVELAVCGMHLSQRFGETVNEVEASGLPTVARIPLPVDDDSAAGMAACAGEMAAAMAAHLAAHRPDALLLLGDRSEMLAAALPAVMASVPIVHLAGGERTGTVDESIRHAVSKLANIHLVSTADAERRLICMGEEPWRVHRVGAPGLVGLEALACVEPADLLQRLGLDPARPYALVLFHSVVQDAAQAARPVSLALAALRRRGLQCLCLMPNADHGGGLIREALHASGSDGSVCLVTHLARDAFASAMANAAVMVGNSSSGIVEAATFGTPVVNVGDRQLGRERNANTIDAEAEMLDPALDAALAMPRLPGRNVYGDGRTDEYVLQVLNDIKWGEPRLLKKQMTY